MSARAFYRQRPLVSLALCYGAGILPGFYWRSFVWLLPAAGLGFALLAFVLLYRKAGARLMAAGFFFFFLGCLLAGLATHPSLPNEGSYQVQARVSGQAQISADGRRVKAILQQVELENEAGGLLSLSRVYWTYYPKEGSSLPQDGQLVRFEGKLYHPPGQVNPHGFNFRDQLLKQGIAVGLSGARELALSPENQPQPASFWLRLRLAIESQLDKTFGDQAPLAKALLLGQRTELEETVQEDFRVTGIAHVLAVSGLHVGFLVLVLTLLLRRFYPSPRLLFALVALFLLFYCRLLDFSPSVVRASVLSLLVLAGRMWKQPVDPLTSLAAAFLLILLIKPLELFSLGFQLSFLAVLGIILLGDRFSSFLAGKAWFARLPKWLQGLCLAYTTTLAASLMTLPPLANAYHRISLVGLLISPPAILLIGLIMQLFILGLLLSYIFLPAAQAVAVVVNALSAVYQADVALAARLPLALVQVAYLSPLWWLPYYALLIIFSRYVRLKRRVRWLGMAVLLLPLIVLPLLPRENSLRYIQLSTGFSDCALILDGHTTWAIDAAEQGHELVSYLKSEGRDLDFLLLTHLHQDHAGGLTQLLDSGIHIGQIYLPQGAITEDSQDFCQALIQRAQQASIPVKMLARGDSLAQGRVKAEVLWPIKEGLYPGLPPNWGSLVLYWELGGLSLLTTGDLGSAYAPYVYQPAQVMKLPHHGSRADNSKALLELVKPQLALITAASSQPQRYQAAQEYLAALGIRHLVTGQTGAITLHIEGDQLRFTTHLDERR